MATPLRFILCRLAAAVLVTASVAACSSVSKGPGGQVSKVKYTHLIPNERFNTTDRSLQFERDYLMHGAVSGAEQMERAGQYYSILWKATDRTQPALVRFEYRQAKTGLSVQSMEVTVDEVKRNNWTHFQVTGPAYLADGRVTAWRAIILQNGAEIASQQSYLWE